MDFYGIEGSACSCWLDWMNMMFPTGVVKLDLRLDFRLILLIVKLGKPRPSQGWPGASKSDVPTADEDDTSSMALE